METEEIDSFPPEILIIIMSNFNLKKLFNLRFVCKYWDVCALDSITRYIVKNDNEHNMMVNYALMCSIEHTLDLYQKEMRLYYKACSEETRIMDNYSVFDDEHDYQTCIRDIEDEEIFEKE